MARERSCCTHYVLCNYLILTCANGDGKSHFDPGSSSRECPCMHEDGKGKGKSKKSRS